MTSTPTPDRRRAAYIDWTRGLAVLLMIEAHTVDSWTRLSSRGSTAYGYAVMLAGLAAPLFMWLAGLSIPLAGASGLRRGLSRRASAANVVKRGLEIFILAFLFRLQAFILSPGAHPVTLFRVDILNIMGPAIVAAGVVWWLVDATTALVIVFGLLATAVTMATPIVRHLDVIGSLPAWVQWYIRPSGDNTTFTSFPWIGFVFAGAAVGTLLSSVQAKIAERRQLIRIGVAGVLVIAGGFYASTLPSIYADSSFWTTSPTYFAIRAGLAMTALATLFAVEQMASRPRPAFRLLAELGQSSLFIYWIHVELVYGYASWPLRRHLPLWGTAIAYVLFTLLMLLAVRLRDRVVLLRRRRSEQMTFQYKAKAVWMRSMRTLLNGVCGLTIAASIWLGTMFVVLHRPGYERGAGMSAVFVAQSLLALAVANRWLPGLSWRILVLAGGAALVWAGASAIVANLQGGHFEGFAVIIGALLVLEGLLTAAYLIPSLLAPSSKVHQFGN